MRPPGAGGDVAVAGPRQDLLVKAAARSPGPVADEAIGGHAARFADNPLVAGDPNIRFYAGAPLVTPAQHYLGTLCVIDTHPRTLSVEQTGALQSLARQVVSQLELRLNLERLEQTRRRLEESVEAERDASKAKSLFLANMSHELRTPLNAIIGYSELLMEDAEDAGQDATFEDLRKIESSGRHLLCLIDEILDLSKIEAGKLQLDPTRFAVGDLLAEAGELVAPQIERNRNTFAIEGAGGIGEACADRNRLKQCLLNLLSSAAKSTEAGRVTLSARREQSEDGDVLRFSVEDTGIGIAPGDLERVFERFEQASGKQPHGYSGTGIGLPLTRHLARLMGGALTAESEPGRGSAFTLVVPAQP